MKNKNTNNTITKVIKLQIINPVNIKWNVFSFILNLLKTESLEIKNFAIQHFWRWNNFSKDYYIVNGHDPRASDILMNVEKGSYYNTISGFINNQLKDNRYSYSSNLSSYIRAAEDKWNKYKKEMYSGKYSIPSFNSPEIELHNKAISFLPEGKANEFTANLSLLSLKGKKLVDAEYKKYLKKKELLNGIDLSQPIISDTSYKVKIKAVDNSTKTILNRIISGEYKQGTGKLINRKNKWFLYLTYSFEAAYKENLDENKILGIDMGVCTPVYMAVSDSKQRGLIGGGEINEFRRRIETRRKSLQEQTKYRSQGSIGHGTKKRLSAVAKIGDKISRFRDTCNHKYSKYVVDFALKNNCGTIQIEDLSGIAKDEKKATFLGDWTYYDLQTKIEYKAKEHGIKVVKIKPHHTSARCNKCGFIHSNMTKDKWRPTQEQFKCMNCDYGHRYFVHADYNAAQNLAMKDIDKIIAEQLKSQEEYYKNTLKYADC
jgi:transposase, IS605 OrfB family, central region